MKEILFWLNFLRGENGFIAWHSKYELGKYFNKSIICFGVVIFFKLKYSNNISNVCFIHKTTRGT